MSPAPSPALPQVPVPPQVPVTAATPGTVFGINLSQSLNANVLRLVEHRFQRLMSAPEIAIITASLNDGSSSFQAGGTLSAFQAGGAAARRDLLELNMSLALNNKTTAWLWANVVEITDRPAAGISELAASFSEGCRSISAMLFMDAATNFAD
jgi:hypothetical protein